MSRTQRMFTGCTSYKTFFLGKEGQIFGSGFSPFSNFGLGKKDWECEDQIKPIQVFPNFTKRVKKISVGEDHLIILTLKKGKCYSLGGNEYGQLALGNEKDRDTSQLYPTYFPPTLITIPGDQYILDVVVGRYHSVFITRNAIFSSGCIFFSFF